MPDLIVGEAEVVWMLQSVDTLAATADATFLLARYFRRPRAATRMLRSRRLVVAHTAHGLGCKSLAAVVYRSSGSGRDVIVYWS